MSGGHGLGVKGLGKIVAAILAFNEKVAIGSAVIKAKEPKEGKLRMLEISNIWLPCSAGSVSGYRGWSLWE